MKKRPTIKDIAKMAGVTHSTVSRVINKNPSISKKTVTKIHQIMRKLRYQPNLIARGLVTNKTRAFALIVPELNPHVLLILKGVVDTCRRFNYGLMLFSTEYWTDENISLPEVSKNWLVDGILIYNVIYKDTIAGAIRELLKEKTPFVFINKYLGTKKVNTVSVDNQDAVHTAMEYLVSQGHRRIGLINGGMLSVDGVERFEAYKDALNRLGLLYDDAIIGYGNFSDENAYHETKRILNSPKNPTAFFCSSDLMATGAIRAIQEKGLKVPEDISIVGFDDWEPARYFRPSLTTMKPPLTDIGHHAINMLIRMIEGSHKTIEEISLKAGLIIRDSSGPCKDK